MATHGFVVLALADREFVTTSTAVCLPTAQSRGQSCDVMEITKLFILVLHIMHWVSSQDEQECEVGKLDLKLLPNNLSQQPQQTTCVVSFACMSRIPQESTRDSNKQVKRAIARPTCPDPTFCRRCLHASVGRCGAGRYKA